MLEIRYINDIKMCLLLRNIFLLFGIVKNFLSSGLVEKLYN